MPGYHSHDDKQDEITRTNEQLNSPPIMFRTATAMKQWLLNPFISITVGLISVLTYAAIFVVTHNVLTSPIPLFRAELLLQHESGQILFIAAAVSIYVGLLGLFLLGTLFEKQGWERRPRICAASYVLVLLTFPALMHIVFGDTMATPPMSWFSPFCFAFITASWLAGMAAAGPHRTEPSRNDLIKVMLAAGLFTTVFFTLALMQYESLRVPHGDSGMYEEHLWNLWNGKGFRSQIDDGRLFLGEHFQFFHVFLMPLYLLHPSLPTLNLCEAAALASGSLAVFLLARRMGMSLAAWPLALAYLLYFPVQYLCLESSWKTFRPETFGSPLVLWALYAIESRRRLVALFLLAFSFTAKEDYAITVAAIGAWMLLRGVLDSITKDKQAASLEETQPTPNEPRRDLFVGLLLAVGSTTFLIWVLLWFIPYFRGGVPHYTSYFHDLGDSPAEVARHLVEKPLLLVDRLMTPRNGAFFFWMMLPLGFLPLLSPTRFAVAIPTFGYLMLSSLDALAQPWFHFHGPLIPVLFWATIGAVKNLSRWLSPRYLGWFVCALCLITGITEGRSPLSWKFWDPQFASPQKTWRGETLFEPMGDYWKSVYLPDERSKAFADVMKVVKPTDRVAATDYIRTRFTHQAAAYDYPILKKHVTIDDIDAIVIDRKEGWWGREPTNPDRELLQAIANDAPVGTRINIRDRPFEVVLDNEFFVVLRQVRSKADQPVSTP